MAELCYNKLRSAGVAHPVERHLAKVEVAGSSPVIRSSKKAGTPCGVSAFEFLAHLSILQRSTKNFVI